MSPVLLPVVSPDMAFWLYGLLTLVTVSILWQCFFYYYWRRRMATLAEFEVTLGTLT